MWSLDKNKENSYCPPVSFIMTNLDINTQNSSQFRHQYKWSCGNGLLLPLSSSYRTRANRSQFRHQYKWSCGNGLLLPLSSSYRTRENRSQQVTETTAVYCYTWCCCCCCYHTLIFKVAVQLTQSYQRHTFVRWSFFFWSIKHASKIWPLILKTLSIRRLQSSSKVPFFLDRF